MTDKVYTFTYRGKKHSVTPDDPKMPKDEAIRRAKALLRAKGDSGNELTSGGKLEDSPMNYAKYVSGLSGDITAGLLDLPTAPRDLERGADAAGVLRRAPGGPVAMALGPLVDSLFGSGRPDLSKLSPEDRKKAEKILGLRPLSDAPQKWGADVVDALGIPRFSDPKKAGLRDTWYNRVLGDIYKHGVTSAIPGGIIGKSRAAMAGAGISGASSGAAYGASKEVTDDPKWQLLASVVGGLLPGAALPAAASGITAARKTKDAFKRVSELSGKNLKPTTAQLTGRGYSVERGRALPLGGAASRAEKERESLRLSMDKIATKMGAARNDAEAGEVLAAGLRSWWKKESKRIGDMYNAARYEGYIDPTRIHRAFESIYRGGAPLDDVARYGLYTKMDRIWKDWQKALRKYSEQGIAPTYNQIESFRRRIGNLYSDGIIKKLGTTNVDKVYKAINDTLRSHAPTAAHAKLIDDARSAAKKLITDGKRIFNPLARRAGEGFDDADRVWAFFQQKTKISRKQTADIINKLKPQERNTIRGYVISRLGTKIEGDRETFTVRKFLDDWGKLIKEDQVKARIVFGKKYMDDLQKIKHAAGSMDPSFPAENRFFMNTLLTSLGGGAGAAFLTGSTPTGSALGGMIMSGGLAAKAYATIPAALTTRLLASDKFMSWLATAVSRAPLTRAVTTLARLQVVIKHEQNEKTKQAMQKYYDTVKGNLNIKED